jgi:rhodanese-related sulfurtransferase
MNTGFGQSCRGYYLLTMLGYPKVKVLDGGFDAWAGKGMPVTLEVPTPAPASFAIVPEAGEILIDAKTMLAALDQPNIALLDVRDVDEWIGESSSRDRRDYAKYPGLSLLLQGGAGVEHVPRAQERRRQGRADVFRLVERMVAGSVAANRGRPADRGETDRQGGIEQGGMERACFHCPVALAPGGEPAASRGMSR